MADPAMVADATALEQDGEYHCDCAGCRMAYATGVDTAKLNHLARSSAETWGGVYLPMVHAMILYLATGAANAESEQMAHDNLRMVKAELDELFEAARDCGADKGKSLGEYQQEAMDIVRGKCADYMPCIMRTQVS